MKEKKFNEQKGYKEAPAAHKAIIVSALIESLNDDGVLTNPAFLILAEIFKQIVLLNRERMILKYPDIVQESKDIAMNFFGKNIKWSEFLLAEEMKKIIADKDFHIDALGVLTKMGSVKKIFSNN